ncbi:MAG: A24 family peptidase [Planctomycetaceae bacterium]
MLATLVVLLFVAVAAWTDARTNMIYNWTTYPGILLGVVVNACERGSAGASDSLAGLVVCGGVILFVFLFGGTGGGDVKLIAMLGAGLGMYDGIEAMLWTFVVGAVFAVAALIWQFGAWRLLRGTLHHLWCLLRARSWVPLTAEERTPLKRTLFLAPAALVAVIVVRWTEIESLKNWCETRFLP